MKLTYLANLRLPTEKAYGVQISKMCEAFANQNLEVELIFPHRKSKIQDDVFTYYSIKDNFKIKKIYSPDFYWPGILDRPAVLIKNLISAFLLAFHGWQGDADIIYSRGALPLYFLSFFKKNLVFEAHKFSEARKFFYQRFKSKNIKIVVISGGIKDKFIKFGFKPENILAAHDGVDLSKFDIELSQEDIRKKLNLSLNKKIVGYVGSFATMGMPKGLDDLFRALASMQNRPTLVLVGGSTNPAETSIYRNLAKDLKIENDVIFVGQVPHKLVPSYLKSFDVLAMPFPYNQHYAYYMSPIKLFEYMASGRPIIASDLPSLREVLNENNCLFAKPDNPSDFADKIKNTLENSDLAQKVSKTALADVKNYTWQKRAESILNFLNI